MYFPMDLFPVFVSLQFSKAISIFGEMLRETALHHRPSLGILSLYNSRISSFRLREVCLLLILRTFETTEDADRFHYIYRQYKRLMLKKAYEILRDPMLAEDAVSEAMIRVYKNIHKIEDPTQPRSIAFLMTILRNVALTMLEREKKQPLSLEILPEDASSNLEHQVLGAISAEAIHRLVDRLPTDQKTVFLLKYAHDLSAKEIAATLQITENNVNVRLHRAKKKLAESLEKEGYLHEQS